MAIERLRAARLKNKNVVDIQHVSRLRLFVVGNELRHARDVAGRRRRRRKSSSRISSDSVRSARFRQRQVQRREHVSSCSRNAYTCDDGVGEVKPAAEKKHAAINHTSRRGQLIRCRATYVDAHPQTRTLRTSKRNESVDPPGDDVRRRRRRRVIRSSCVREA